jgi:multiple sugar transport system ATP-binding protein
MASVSFRKVSKRYGNIEVIRDLNLTVKDGEFVTLVGPSGCGKSTTLRLVAGLEEITSGELYIGDTLANTVAPKKRGISMVFQSYALFPHMTVSENVAFGLKIRKHPRSDILSKLDWAVDLLGLQGLVTRLPRDLSGGERQRVALARALVLEPEVLLLDEPLSNLDAKLRLKMRAELKRIHKKLKSTILYVTHDQVEAMSLSDRVAIMHRGDLQQVSTPMEVYRAPRNIFVATFIGSPAMNLMEGRITEENGIPCIDLETFTLCLPRQHREKCTAYSGRKVMFGIRPEDIYDRRSSKITSSPENTVSVVTDVIEPLGDRVVVEVTKGKANFSILLEPEAEVKSDASLRVVFDMAKAHIFDRESEKNILHPS